MQSRWKHGHHQSNSRCYLTFHMTNLTAKAVTTTHKSTLQHLNPKGNCQHGHLFTSKFNHPIVPEQDINIVDASEYSPQVKMRGKLLSSAHPRRLMSGWLKRIGHFSAGNSYHRMDFHPRILFRPCLLYQLLLPARPTASCS